jgi:hypothetical protein
MTVRTRKHVPTTLDKALAVGIPWDDALGIVKGEDDPELEIAAYLMFRYDDQFGLVDQRKDYLVKAALLRDHFARSQCGNERQDAE